MVELVIYFALRSILPLFEGICVKIIHKRRRRNPKLSKSTIAMIDRREAKIERLLARPATLLREMLIKRTHNEIALMIEADEELFDAKENAARARVISKWESRRAGFVDRRTREYKASQARAAAAPAPDPAAMPQSDPSPVVEPVIAAPVEPVLESVAPPADDWRAQIRAAAIADGVPLSDLAPEQPSR
jgi:hypothetical protein